MCILTQIIFLFKYPYFFRQRRALAKYHPFRPTNYSNDRNVIRNPKGLLVTADGGGSNGYRVRLWKVELQKLADELKFPITVCHLPPGTSKWNKIEHRLFSFISINWRGKPLRSFRTIVELIAATTTETGLTVRAELDEKKYPKGLKISDAQLATVNIFPHDFHGEWNYTIAPNKKRRKK